MVNTGITLDLWPPTGHGPRSTGQTCLIERRPNTHCRMGENTRYKGYFIRQSTTSLFGVRRFTWSRYGNKELTTVHDRVKRHTSG